MTLAEKLDAINAEPFGKVVGKMTEQVMDGLTKWGHHTICFHFKKDVELVRLERYPDGSDRTEIHILMLRHAERYLKEQGLRVDVDYWMNGQAKCINVSI